MSFKQIISGTNPLASDADQYRLALTGQADVGALSLCPPQATPAAPTVAASTSSGCLNGAYYYKVVLITGWLQTDGSYFVQGFAPSIASTQVTAASKQIILSAIPTGGTGTIGRAIYRTAAGGATGTEKYCDVIWNNAVIYTDNIADGSLGTGMPGSASTTAAYGTPIPANVPTSNTTGTTMAAGNYKGVISINGTSTTLIAGHAGSFVEATGTGGYTITLPILGAGSTFIIENNSSGTITISTSASFYGAGVLGASFIMPQYAVAIVVCDGTNWFVMLRNPTPLISVTLTAAGWSGATQTVNAAGVLTSSNLVVGVAGTANSAARAASRAASIYATSQGNGTVTFVYDTIQPTVDIPFNITITG